MDQRQFFLRDILTVIFKHKTLITVLPILVFATVFVGNYVWPATYEAEAKVRLIRGREVSQADPTVTPAAQELTMVQMGVEDINSEIQLIHSRDLLEGVVLKEGLDQDSAFPYGSGILDVPFRIARQSVDLVLYALQLKSKPQAVQKAMDELDSRLLAEPIRDTHVLDVRLQLGDPEKAQQILATVLDEYKTLHIEIFANEKSSPFFERQKARTEEALDKSQKALQQFRKGANISLLDTERELLLQQYTQATKILSQLSESESAIGAEDLDSGVVSSLASQTESTVVREMQLRLLELTLERNRVIQSLGPKHPTVESLRKRVIDAQSNLVEAIATTKEITKNKLEVIQARLDQLNETMAQLEELQQDVDILSEQYGFYAQKLEQSTVADKLAEDAISNVRIASTPSLPVDPIRPNKLMNLALALIGGIIAALAIAFLLDYLDHGLKTPEDIEYYLKVPPLASFFNTRGQPLNTREAERLAVLLDASSKGATGRCIEVTSSVGGEGANQVSSALAGAFANDPDSKTLLIDVAGNVPAAKSTSYGLTDVLLDQANLDEVLTDSDSLTILGRGSHTDYPAYLWASERMTGLMDDLRKRYRYIVFNAGPALQGHAPMRLALHADGIVLVIKADGTRREVVSRALDMFKDESRDKVAGAVLTERTQTIPQAVYRRI